MMMTCLKFVVKNTVYFKHRLRLANETIISPPLEMGHHLRHLTSAATSKAQSLSYSGAGFLGCYHTGVTAALLRHNFLSLSSKDSSTDPTTLPLLTGVSAGSLTCAAIHAGVSPENSMNVILSVSERTRQKGGWLDVLRPGFSLLDQLEDLFVKEMQLALGGSSTKGDYDWELMKKRMDGGRLLRVGLMHVNHHKGIGAGASFDLNMIGKTQLESYAYVDQYRDLEDVISACMLSSYIPLGTGPLRANQDESNTAVKRAHVKVMEMEQLGFVKHGITGKPLHTKSNERSSNLLNDEKNEGNNEVGICYMDGGLVNNWPQIDSDTIIVSPIKGTYTNPHISPADTSNPDESPTIPNDLQEFLADLTKSNPFFSNLQKLPVPNMDIHPPTVQVSDSIRFDVTRDNLETLFRMMKSSEDSVLEERFQQGYNDAT